MIDLQVIVESPNWAEIGVRPSGGGEETFAALGGCCLGPGEMDDPNLAAVHD